jgi:hypothetical protein
MILRDLVEPALPGAQLGKFDLEVAPIDRLPGDLIERLAGAGLGRGELLLGRGEIAAETFELTVEFGKLRLLRLTLVLQLLDLLFQRCLTCSAGRSISTTTRTRPSARRACRAASVRPAFGCYT